MKYFALSYDVVADFAARTHAASRGAPAPAARCERRGLLLFSGALGDTPDGALLVFRAESAAQVEAFARIDPYVAEGLVPAWRVRPWNVVIGGEFLSSRAL